MPPLCGLLLISLDCKGSAEGLVAGEQVCDANLSFVFFLKLISLSFSAFTLFDPHSSRADHVSSPNKKA